MPLLLTSVLPFLAHDHASAAAFVTCRSHNLHGSIIPEFLSDDGRVQRFCHARQRNQREVDKEKQYKTLYNLFVQTPLMQFSPSLVVSQKDCAESILKPLLETKYFTRSLQRCTVECDLSNDLFEALSKVQSLTKLDLGESDVKNQHLEIIINSFPSLETLTLQRGYCLDPTTAIRIKSPPPPAATKTLRSLTMRKLHPLFAVQFVPHFPNLRKLVLCAQTSFQDLDLLPLSSSLPLLADLELENFTLENSESLKNLEFLSSIALIHCRIPDSLSFLSHENSLPHLTKFCVSCCPGLDNKDSFAPLSHAPNLQLLEVVSDDFDNDCLQYLENMVHLRKLELNHGSIVGDGDGRSLKTLMQNLFQLEELDLSLCKIGKKDAIAGVLYNNNNLSRLRVLNLSSCALVDDDLDGIDALKNTLEVLDVSCHYANLTNEALRHCKDLVKLKKLDLQFCFHIDDLSRLKDCLSLEELVVRSCQALTDDSFRVFSEEPNSFPNLSVLDMSYCKLTQKVFEHLSINNHLVYRLKELKVEGMSDLLLSSFSARKNICQLQGLRSLIGILSDDYGYGYASSEEVEVIGELVERLKNIEEIK